MKHTGWRHRNCCWRARPWAIRDTECQRHENKEYTTTAYLGILLLRNIELMRSETLRVQEVGRVRDGEVHASTQS